MSLRSESQQILPTSAEEAVDEAVDLATRFATARKEDDAGKSETIREIAKESKLRASFIQRLLEPARRPKRVDGHVRNRLLQAYLDYLRRKLVRIETEVARLEAIARPDHAAVRSLAARARSIADRIDTLI